MNRPLLQVLAKEHKDARQSAISSATCGQLDQAHAEPSLLLAAHAGMCEVGICVWGGEGL